MPLTAAQRAEIYGNPTPKQEDARQTGAMKRLARLRAQERLQEPAEEPPVEPEDVQAATEVLEAEKDTDPTIIERAEKVLESILSEDVDSGSRSRQSQRIQAAKAVLQAEARRVEKEEARQAVTGSGAALTEEQLERAILDVEKNYLSEQKGTDPAKLHELEALSEATTRRIVEDVAAQEKQVNVVLGNSEANDAGGTQNP